jgi:hypothetical protein
VSTSIAFLILITNDQPVPALLVPATLCPVPYNGLALVGVWRSAARHDGSALRSRPRPRRKRRALMAVLSLT